MGWECYISKEYRDGTYYIHFIINREELNKPVEYVRGILKTTGFIDFTDIQTAVPADPTLYYYPCSVETDPSGYPCVLYAKATQYPSWSDALLWISKSSTNDGTWVTKTGYPKQISVSQGVTSGQIVRFGSLLYIYFVLSSDYAKGRTLNPSTDVLGDAETASEYIPLDNYCFGIASDDSGELHSAITKSTDYKIYYRKRTASAWLSSELIVTGENNSRESVAITDSGPVVLFTIQTAMTLKRAMKQDSTWSVDTLKQQLFGMDAFSVAARITGNKVGYIYVTGTVTPYTIYFDASPLPLTWKADVLFKKLGITKTYTTDTLLQKKDIQKTVNVDALMKKLGIEKTTPIDTLFKKLGIPITKNMDALFKKLGIERIANADTLFKKLGMPKTITIDSLLKKSNIPIQKQIDTLFRKTVSKTFLIDVILAGAITYEVSKQVDALFKKLNLLKTFGVDVDFLKRDIIKSFAIDTFFGATITHVVSKQVDALFKRLGISKTFGVDVDLERTILIQGQVDALFRKTQQIGKDLDALFKKCDVLKAFAIDTYFGVVLTQTVVQTVKVDVLFRYKVKLPMFISQDGQMIIPLKRSVWVGD